METPETTETLENISRISQMTESGEIQWKALNPSTYVWARPKQHARLVIQTMVKNVVKVEGGTSKAVSVRAYVLQGFDDSVPGTVPAISFDSVDEEYLANSLQQLFETIKRNVDRRRLAFLKTMIEPD